MGETLTTSIVMLIYFLSGVLPWALALGAIVLLVRTGLRLARGGSWRRRAGATAVTPASDEKA